MMAKDKTDNKSKFKSRNYDYEDIVFLDKKYEHIENLRNPSGAYASASVIAGIDRERIKKENKLSLARKVLVGILIEINNKRIQDNFETFFWCVNNFNEVDILNGEYDVFNKQRFHLRKLYSHAVEVFGGIEEAENWFYSYNYELDDVPFNYLSDIDQSRSEQIDELLLAIKYGDFS